MMSPLWPANKTIKLGSSPKQEDGLKKIEAIAAGAEFLGFDDVSTMGQVAPEPVKSLIVKLPAKKTIKPGNRLEDASRKMASRK